MEGGRDRYIRWEEEWRSKGEEKGYFKGAVTVYRQGLGRMSFNFEKVSKLFQVYLSNGVIQNP